MNPEFDIDIISGLKPECVLAALYNAARPIGMGFLQSSNQPMTEEQAASLLSQAQDGWLDYVYGRPLKVQIKDGILRRYDLYDRDQGRGKAASVIAGLRQERA